ncbi:MAG: hypothetical protein HY897_25515 [Deltaproteobacteria bacterium]|nr:hypothetical protein [Deltaproteobacteria bacterium]
MIPDEPHSLVAVRPFGRAGVPRIRLPASLIVFPIAAVLLGACDDNCRTLSERLCSFFEGGYFKPGAVERCLSKTEQTYESAAVVVRWEDEYRCGHYLKSCTREALALGEPQECGLAACGPFSPCIAIWHEACDCQDDPFKDRLARCHSAAENAYFTVVDDRKCGREYRQTCDCAALAAGECKKCGFSPCGPFSPCIGNWNAACGCVWEGFPEQLDACTSLPEIGAYVPPETNPFSTTAAALFGADEDLRCGAGRGECTCEALAAGDCAKCGFRNDLCVIFSPCRVLSHRLCDCAVPGIGGRAVCRRHVDVGGVFVHSPELDKTCGLTGPKCACDTLNDPESCPSFAPYAFSACRTIAYELCSCPDVAEEAQIDCLTRLVYPADSPGFTPDQETECAAMKETCDCGALAAGQGCPEVFYVRAGK